MADLSSPPHPPDRVLPPPLPGPRRGRLAWFGHLFFLSAWLLTLILLWYFQIGLSGHPRKPLGSVAGVLLGVGLNALLFGAVCVAAWGCSRATAAEWLLRWRGGAGPVWRGVLYSVALRIVVLIVSVVVVFALVAGGVITADNAEQFKPHPENAVDPHALVSDRAFFWCVVTLFSASAGFLEEAWRGGMLAGLAGAFPRAFGGPVGSWVAILPVAVLFGLGHLYMGWAAVAATTVLGVGLGAITVWHRTIWDAVITHALFDAGSFALLAWTLRYNPHLLGS